jgi:hypothetical protein
MSKTTTTTHPPSGAIALAALLLAILALTLAPLALGTSPAAAGVLAPLPSSDYSTRPACPTPQPGHASCLALELVPTTNAARARTHPLGTTRSGPIQADDPREAADGLTPADLKSAYFPGERELPEAPTSEPQTIALVDAYNDPQAEVDLAIYDREFGIEECTEADDCFEKVNEHGERENPPFPVSEAAREKELETCENTSAPEATRAQACFQVLEAEGWAVEISTDIEVAHAICQRHCHIVLVEADSTSYEDLETAERTAVRLGGERAAKLGLAPADTDTEVSNSWGGSEPQANGSSKATDSPAFDHAGVVITAAAGDDGYLNWTEAAEAREAEEHGEESGYFVGADYPASSPHVVAVGGTRLTLADGAWKSETVWNDDPRGGSENYGGGGSGCSSQFEAPSWQLAVADFSEVGCGVERAVADVAADADPYSGVAVYDSVPDLRREGNQTVNTPLHWWPIGGTSVASPIVASMFALAGGAHEVPYPARTLYAHLETPLLHAVTGGGNGECDDLYTFGCSGSMSPLSPLDCGEGVLICNSAPACEGHYYDGPTGVGTPAGIGAFKPSEKPAKDPAKCEPTGTSGGGEPKGGSGSGSGNTNPGSTDSGGNGNGGGKTPVTSGGGETITAGNQPSTSGGAGSSSQQTNSSTKPSTAIRLSGLTLTAAANAAVSRGGPTVSQVAFAFTLSAPAKIRAVLYVLAVVHGHRRWVLEPGSLTATAAQGHNRLHLRGGHALAPGRYRLTLTPAHGSARSLTFTIG